VAGDVRGEGEHHYLVEAVGEHEGGTALWTSPSGEWGHWLEPGRRRHRLGPRRAGWDHRRMPWPAGGELCCGREGAGVGRASGPSVGHRGWRAGSEHCCGWAGTGG
jgi:hypothetical protein